MFDTTLGWDLPERPARKVKKNCLGEGGKCNWNGRARTTKDLVNGHEVVGLFGDSFTHWDEVDDEFIISSVFTSQLNLPSKNFGVEGFGPTQALLKFKRVAEGGHFKIAVLQIMHKHFRRMPHFFSQWIMQKPRSPIPYKPFTYKSAIQSIVWTKNGKEFQASVDKAWQFISPFSRQTQTEVEVLQ